MSPASAQGAPWFAPAQYGNATTQPGINGLGAANVGAASGPGGFNDINTMTGNSGETIMQALMGLGWNPTSQSVGMKNILSHANDIVQTALARAAQGGQLDQMMTSPQGGQAAFLQAIQQLVQEGARGGRVLGGMPMGVLDQLNAKANAANAGTDTSASAQILATILSDPNKAADMAASLLYGGMPGAISNAMQRPLMLLPSIYQNELQSGRIGPGTPGGDVTALSLLNRLLGQGPASFSARQSAY